MKAPEYLTKAAAIMEQRAKDYDAGGDGERSVPAVVICWNAITGKAMTDAEGWLFLQLLKDVRQWSAPGLHQDSAEDCIAYAALKAEALSAGSVPDHVHDWSGSPGDEIRVCTIPGCNVVAASRGAMSHLGETKVMK